MMIVDGAAGSCYSLPVMLRATNMLQSQLALSQPQLLDLLCA